MIVYFDTSAVVPLIVDEPASAACVRLWNDADRAVSVRLLYPEGRAALAGAARVGRLTMRQLAAAVDALDGIVAEIDHVELSELLAHAAGELAQAHGLRGHDAVHLAAALATASDDLVVATGDAELGAAARAIGLATALTS